jgi:antitoxin component of MazEF toxin-antitoxin module
MIKTISKIGNSQGVIFDAALMELARLKVGDEVNVEVHEGGTLTMTRIRPQPPREEVTRTIKETMRDYSKTMRRLAR